MTNMKPTQIAEKLQTFLASKREGMGEGEGGEATLALTQTGAAEGYTERSHG